METGETRKRDSGGFPEKTNEARQEHEWGTRTARIFVLSSLAVLLRTGWGVVATSSRITVPGKRRNSSLLWRGTLSINDTHTSGRSPIDRVGDLCRREITLTTWFTSWFVIRHPVTMTNQLVNRVGNQVPSRHVTKATHETGGAKYEPASSTFRSRWNGRAKGKPGSAYRARWALLGFFSARRGHRTIVLLEVVRRVESKVQRDTEGLGGWIHFFLGIPSKPGLPGWRTTAAPPTVIHFPLNDVWMLRLGQHTAF